MPVKKKALKKHITLASKKKRRSVKNKNSNWQLFFLLFGINLVFISSLYLFYKRTVLSFKASPIVISTLSYRLPNPTKIIIKSIGVDLDISQSQISSGLWQTSNTTVNHLDTSARPNEGGNIVLYGHNTRKIFGSLSKIKIKDQIDIINSDAKTISYEVTKIEVVDPDNISVVLPTDNEILTLYTCTGFLDSKRLVVKAVPVKAAS